MSGLATAALVALAPGIGASADPPGGSQIPTGGLHAEGGSTTRSTGNGDAVQTLSRIRLFQEVDSLKLSPSRSADIVGRLTQLESADHTYQQGIAAATEPIAGRLQRMETALMEGHRPAADDEAAVGQALGPLGGEGSRVDQLRKRTIQAILTDLSLSQITEIRRYLEMPTDRGVTPGGPAIGQTPGGPAPDQPGAATPGGDGTGPETPGAGANGAPPAMFGRMLDKFRRMPKEDFDEQKKEFEAGHVKINMNGVVVTDPAFTAASGGVNFYDQMDQIRQMSDTQFQQARDLLATKLMQQFQAYSVAHPQPESLDAVPGAPGGDAGAAEAALDVEAIRRFFLQADVLRYLRTRMMGAARIR